ncbi:MAG: dephospho-CoA kinase [Clostridiales bacterium]|nr:dephospho-CoA kinase [Clostridiales bacterium]
MKLIGLTGGIGAGKSTVSDYLKQKGYPVLDADLVAREIVEPGTETLSELSRTFGEEILNPDGSLDRGALAKIAFSDPENKKILDQIMHGKVIEILLSRAKAMTEEPVVFIDVPLLFETGMDRYMDQVWLVDADEDVRIQRVMERDGSSMEDVRKRIRYQSGRDEKIKRSDVVLNNCCDRDILYKQIDERLSELWGNEGL